MLVTVEGNIGAGKSTLLKKLENVEFAKPHLVVYEPVGEWLNVKPDGPDSMSLFEKYYHNKERFGFMFQMYALQTRLAHITETIKNNPDKIIICERTHLTDAEIFAKMLFRDKLIDSYEYFVYKSWYDHVCASLADVVNGAVYLRASPPTCMTRIAKRNRDGEEEISVHYIRTLHTMHDEWLLKSPMPSVIINGDVEEDDVDIDSIVHFVNAMI